jgi:hypothetical protein
MLVEESCMNDVREIHHHHEAEKYLEQTAKQHACKHHTH